MRGIPGILFSAAEESFPSAVQELRGEFGRKRDVERLGPDVGVLDGNDLDVAEVARACAAAPLVFVRHLSVERRRMATAEAGSVGAVAGGVRSVLAGADTTGGLAVQVWSSGTTMPGFTAGGLYQHLAEALGADGVVVGHAARPTVLSCCFTRRGLSLGLNAAEHSLTDWPGGRVRLRRAGERVSRAEFKLEELFGTLDLDLPAGGTAADFGASPGGWTRVLRGRGLRVVAIDPGDLDPRVLADPKVRHVRGTVGRFLGQDRTRFDLLVNDMRMDPELSCRVMTDAAGHLRPGAPVIMTLKIGGGRPVRTVRDCLAILAGRYTVRFARQLHHNRQEVTVVAHRSR